MLDMKGSERAQPTGSQNVCQLFLSGSVFTWGRWLPLGTQGKVWRHSGLSQPRGRCFGWTEHRMQLNTLPRAGQAHSEELSSPVSAVLRLRNQGFWAARGARKEVLSPLSPQFILPVISPLPLLPWLSSLLDQSPSPASVQLP